MKSAGNNIWIISGIVMVLFEVFWFYQWWGFAGVIASLVLFPLAAIFPFIYLVKEGFSMLYFGVWGLGILGIILGSEKDSNP